MEYLMSRGISRDKATATIVRGFLRVDIEGLPELLEEEINRTLEAADQDVM